MAQQVLGYAAIAMLAWFAIAFLVLRPNDNPRRWFWYWVWTGRPHPDQLKDAQEQ